MIAAAALASLALIVAATEVVARGLARIPGFRATPAPRYTMTGASRGQLTYFARA